MMAIASTAWVLIVAAHVYYGSTISMVEFADQSACEYAAKAARSVAEDAGAGARTWCVPKGSK